MRRVREDWGLARDCGWSLLRVTGPDRVSFLHALLSQDLKDLDPGQGAPSGFLDRKGHLRTQLLVHVTDSHIILFAPTTQAEMLCEGLLGFRITEQVEIDTSPGWGVWLVSGPQSPAVLRSWGILEGEGGAWPLGYGRSFLSDLEKGWVVRARYTGEMDFFVAVPPGGDSRLLENVQEERKIPLQALDHLRLEAGIPMSPNEIDGRRLPQEVDLDDIVSLTKGCFLGQETMARLTHRDQLRNRLAGWILEDGVSPSSGAVFKDGVEVGEVTSLLRRISVSGTLAMGILKLSARGPEGIYRFASPEGAPGRLVDLPFVRGSGFDVDPRWLRQGAEKE